MLLTCAQLILHNCKMFLQIFLFSTTYVSSLLLLKCVAAINFKLSKYCS